MKYDSFKVLIILVFLFSVLSCSLLVGETGSDGESYIAYNYYSSTEITYTNDPAFPIITEIQDGVYEKTVPGTYSFEYIDNSTWTGEYTIYVNEGMNGGLFVDGLNGRDVYFELTMYSSGPSFYDWIEPKAVTKKLGTLTDSEVYIETFHKGNFTVVLKYKKID